MTAEIERPDLPKIMAGLKDFQRLTVEQVFRRLYRDDDQVDRFLIADEVGLGKTMVAKGLIANVIDHLWDKVKRIDIVYICSNADIARQNVNRLNIYPESEFELASRITLLPALISDLKQRKLNFVSFTPGTSFELQSSQGRADERALLYLLLRDPWKLSGARPLNVLRGNMGKENFENWVSYYATQSIDSELSQAFALALEQRPELHQRFDSLCAVFTRSDSRYSDENYRDRSILVGELRALLASTCLRALEPDLIILDEFQRFKDLLNAEDEAGRLARDLFAYEDADTKARVVLLSATPYKMYTLQQESAENDHYKDFIQTLNFLFHRDQSGAERIRALLGGYRQETFRLGNGGGQGLLEIKDELQTQLRRIMVRTERLAATADRDGMLIEKEGTDALLTARDLKDYIALATIAKTIGYHDPVEYWKSAPYLLNFTSEYEFRTRFDSLAEGSESSPTLARLLTEQPSLLLSWKDIERYQQIDPGNARLRRLLTDTVELGAWRLLWIPPALPYYRLQGAFSEPTLKRFTKRLVFSAWRMVPRVIAGLVSYEAERRVMTSVGISEKYTDREKVARPLQFSRKDGRPTDMSAMALLYPSLTLARECDPLRYAVQQPIIDLPAVESIIDDCASRLERLLASLPIQPMTTGAEDPNWYWAAPVLLDQANAASWLEQSDLAALWAGEEDSTEAGSVSAWAAHVQELRRLTKHGQDFNLGPFPKDLFQVLARIGLGGPGTCVLRALMRVTGADSNSLMNSAAPAGRAFITLFNLPDVAALLRNLNPAEPYWQRVLDYTIAGGLQSVLDEYAHVLREGLGLVNIEPEAAAGKIGQEMRRAIQLRTSRVGFDEIRVSDAGHFRTRGRNMRNRFAVRFAAQESDEGGESTRPDQVRSAFNSPFWPFVLITTSVGQEGLDFHTYCHAVMHWNLPSNPVDLEQREGRVHRYKGHAVRKNIADRFGPTVLGTQSTSTDPWSSLFAHAVHERASTSSDLEPFWVFTFPGGAKIERHVLALPLSRDHAQADALRQSLAVYRMVFGQSRQEDMLAYLTQHLPHDIVERAADLLRVDLSPASL